MMAPVLARGRSNERVISGFVIGGSSTAITVGSVSGLVVGMKVFVGEADLSLAEYVGWIVAIDGLVVTVRFVARRGRSAWAKLWTPSAVWQAVSVPSISSWEAEDDPGLERLETTGKAALLTQVRDAREVVRLGLGTSVSDWAGFRSWLKANVGGGMGALTAAWADRDSGLVRTAKVRLEDAERGFRAGVPVAGWRTWEVGFAVLAEDVYL